MGDRWGTDGGQLLDKKSQGVRYGDMDNNKNKVMTVMRQTYGPEDATRWFQRWRIFFMACAELWGYRDGREWLVSHYLLSKKSL